MKARIALMLAVALGAALELVVSGFSESAEAWDSSMYWSVGYPSAVILCGVLGFSSPGRWQIHGPLLLGAQWVTMAVGNSAGPLMFVGLFVAAALSVPCVVAGWVGANAAGDASRADDLGNQEP